MQKWVISKVMITLHLYRFLIFDLSPTGAVQHYFPGKTDSEIKGYIRQKLQNEAKRLRKKPHLAVKVEPEAGSEGAESTFYI